MKYGVKNLNDGVIPESSHTDVFETANSLAISWSNWNIPCQIVDLETGEPLKEFEAYKDWYTRTIAVKNR